ncbi:hypothetical protein [Chelatococcus asaccharovorans]|nr:hypothetical protein [Chelatococcus asaccharovorans]MBS7703568.1 hypothetical protein [Chelatococcus asaccharovorans]
MIHKILIYIIFALYWAAFAAPPAVTRMTITADQDLPMIEHLWRLCRIASASPCATAFTNGPRDTLVITGLVPEIGLSEFGY